MVSSYFMQKEQQGLTYIAHAVGIVSKFNAEPSQAHLNCCQDDLQILERNI